MALCFTLGSSALAQSVHRRPDALRVFIDCAKYTCDYDFLRREIGFVNHMRERRDAQVVALVTAERTGSGGIGFTVGFIGQQDFRGADDSLRHVTLPTESQDQVRRALAELLKRGLVRYANHTPVADGLRISYAAPVEQRQTAARAQDPWNYWAFGTALNGTLSGERSSMYIGLNVSLAADRTTEAWKINTSLQGAYTENRIDVSGTSTVRTVSRDYGADILAVKSLGGHWSAGVQGTLTSSTFLNQSLALRLAPAVEYNVFPYAESSRRQFTLQYSTGATAFDYSEETIFGRTAETLWDQKLVASLEVIQPWGSVASSLEGSHYVRDLSKWHGIATNRISLRLFGGFSLHLSGGVELVHDQLYLPRAGASEEEILLRQHQLSTSYRYWSSIGFGYTFGSRFANVVNPRFSGAGRGLSAVR